MRFGDSVRASIYMEAKLAAGIGADAYLKTPAAAITTLLGLEMPIGNVMFPKKTKKKEKLEVPLSF